MQAFKTTFLTTLFLLGTLHFSSVFAADEEPKDAIIVKQIGMELALDMAQISPDPADMTNESSLKQNWG